MLRKAPVLPIMFCGGDSSGVGGVGGDGGSSGSGDSEGGGVTGVTGDVGGRGGVTGGTGGSAGGSVIGSARRRMGSQCGGARLAHRDLATHPCTPRCDCFPRAVVVRVLLLKVGEDMFGAGGGPEHQCPVVLLVEPRGGLHLHRVLVCLT